MKEILIRLLFAAFALSSSARGQQANSEHTPAHRIQLKSDITHVETMSPAR
jgi:hypothetical protein